MNCVICTRLISHNDDDVRATVCGHVFHYICLIQWLESSKTCPKCRNECTEENVFRLYLNFENLDGNDIDVGLLEEELDSMKLELQHDKEKLKKDDELMDKTVRFHCEVNKRLQENEKEMKMMYMRQRFFLKHQIIMLKDDVRRTEEIRKEIESLKQQFQTVEDGTFILSPINTEDEMKENQKTLSFCVESIKRELEKCKKEKCRLQSDLQREIESKKKVEERMCDLENLIKIRLPSTF